MSHTLQRYITDNAKYDRMLMTNDIEGKNKSKFKLTNLGAKPRKFIRDINYSKPKANPMEQQELKSSLDIYLSQYIINILDYPNLYMFFRKNIKKESDSLDNFQKEFIQKK